MAQCDQPNNVQVKSSTLFLSHIPTSYYRAFEHKILEIEIYCYSRESKLQNRSQEPSAKIYGWARLNIVTLKY